MIKSNHKTHLKQYRYELLADIMQSPIKSQHTIKFEIGASTIYNHYAKKLKQ